MARRSKQVDEILNYIMDKKYLYKMEHTEITTKETSTPQEDKEIAELIKMVLPIMEKTVVILRDIISTGWPKSNVPKVGAYCSGSDHLIRKIFQGCVGIFTASRNI